ncbi:MAG: hypothetical protein HY791_38280 [Deltaproteobacteria bacterium]|nr:hypothetical protein [Deltaproteobacteria bacterium]
MTDRSSADTNVVMTTERKIAAVLTDLPVPDEGHISDEVLAAAADRGRVLSGEQVTHLSACGECRAALAAASGRGTVTELGSRRGPLVALAAAASIAFFVGVRTEVPADRSEPRSKGAAVSGEAEVKLLAISERGARDLADGGFIRLDERIGFVYGNPEGRHSRLSILGWDGEEIHWYYPELSGQPGVTIERGPAARSVRLPFDIALGEAHRRGKLTVAAAFDLAPDALAMKLRAGGQIDLPSVSVFRLSVTQANAP